MRRISGVVLGLSMAAGVFAQAADGFFTRAGRPNLKPDAELWREVQANVGRAGQPLGYSYEEMLGYPPFEYRLRSIENLFRDILAPSEYGGLLGNNLLAKANEPAQAMYVLWSQLDARAGREWAVPTKAGEWGVDWIKPGSAPIVALRKCLDRPSTLYPYETKLNFQEADKRVLIGAGDPAIRFVARLAVAALVSEAYFSAAPKLDGNYRLVNYLVRHSERAATFNSLVSPYLGDVNDDTITVSDRMVYEFMREWDRNYSAFGTAIFMRHFDAALAELRDAKGPKVLGQTLRFKAPLGDIVIGSNGDDVHTKSAAILVDLGGNDTYKGLIATPSALEHPVSAIVDLGGDDVYDGRSADGNVACGFMGLGLLCDLKGNDTYKVKNGGLGFGLYGSGILIDHEGNDTYEAAKGWAQGAAYAGVGLLLDHKGDDKYRTICMSMGFGGTLGVGALVDVEGNDDYFTADTGNDSKVWGKTVSMCLGSGYGRRCDSGDGQNQGGGIGVVVEGAGDDKYHTSIFSLGSGYWWGAGIFEERGGNDTYRCTHYCLGSGGHFAVGSFVDVSGNDRYNDRPDAVERWGGLGRDGAVAVCIDAEGNDVWGNLTGGHSDLNSVSMFWDREGDDVYKRMQPFDPTQWGNRPFGSAVPYPSLDNFRDRLFSAGIFIDTKGRDLYPPGMTAADTSTWKLLTGPQVWGFGYDGDRR